MCQRASVCICGQETLLTCKFAQVTLYPGFLILPFTGPCHVMHYGIGISLRPSFFHKGVFFSPCWNFPLCSAYLHPENTYIICLAWIYKLTENVVHILNFYYCTIGNLFQSNSHIEFLLCMFWFLLTFLRTEDFFCTNQEVLAKMSFDLPIKTRLYFTVHSAELFV